MKNLSGLIICGLLKQVPPSGRFLRPSVGDLVIGYNGDFLPDIIGRLEGYHNNYAFLEGFDGLNIYVDTSDYSLVVLPVDPEDPSKLPSWKSVASVSIAS